MIEMSVMSDPSVHLQAAGIFCFSSLLLTAVRTDLLELLEGLRKAN